MGKGGSFLCHGGVDLTNVTAITARARFFITLPLKQVTVTEISDASNISVGLLTEQLHQKLGQGLGQCPCLGEDPQGTMCQILLYLCQFTPVLVPVSFFPL